MPDTQHPTPKRPRGRPPVPEELRYDRIGITLPPDLLDWLRHEAAANGMSISSYVAETCRARMKREKPR